MIPLRDRQRQSSYPVVTLALIGCNSLVWLYEVGLGPRLDGFILQYGLTPLRFILAYRFEGGIVDNAIIPLFSSIFMHGGWLHVIGNMWFLWIFGDNVEDRMGHFRFLLFYLLCGIGASLAFVLVDPFSRMPMVGASGAISGVLGSYLVTFPGARILTIPIIFIPYWLIEVPAWIFLIIWFLFQFLGASQASAHGEVGGVAYGAHIGGFVTGILLTWIMRKRPRFRKRSWEEDPF